jgi:hypothetical protein
MLTDQKYAVNLVGLMNLKLMPQHWGVYWLLRDIVTDTVVQDKGETMGHEALLVRDDVSTERWQAIVKIIRMKWRKNANEGMEKCLTNVNTK